ncbi:hypothetical protein [Pseudomonas sp. NBRC 111139]|uniref:hypothetical protein n=1 Tax=Pseudomonas sp. NBRC 111139 TaxID=1661054 RepID=UPI001112E5E7|nr:hypothetical protein [Pseudomonas sp. NBRC 111139]
MSAEKILNQVLKKVLVVVLGSGVLVNALYLFGMSYYEGFIKALGFELLMFPIAWSDGRLWTYIASREIGLSAVSVWVELTGPYVLLLMAVCYATTRIWLKAKKRSTINAGNPTGRRRKFLKSVAYQKKKHPIIFAKLLWFVRTDDAFWAFISAYSIIIFVFFIPLFLIVWSFYPSFGFAYGEKVGERVRKSFESALCGENGEYWSSCFVFSTKHIDQEGLPGQVLGRLVFKKDRTIGLYTKNGPVTLTLPEDFYQETKRNACYRMCCPGEK